MRIKPGFRLRSMFGKHTIVAEGVSQMDFNKIIVLNDSAAIMWRSAVDRDFCTDDLAQALIDHYGIDHETAHNSADRMCRQWIENGLIEEL